MKIFFLAVSFKEKILNIGFDRGKSALQNPLTLGIHLKRLPREKVLGTSVLHKLLVGFREIFFQQIKANASAYGEQKLKFIFIP
jgi:hypothetical protein